MTGETTGSALLAIALATLERDIAPELSGDARFKARMVASALGMAMRERERGAALAAALAEAQTYATEALGEAVTDGPALCRALRAGRLNGDPAMHQALYRHAAIATGITRPAALQREEQVMAGFDAEKGG